MNARGRLELTGALHWSIQTCLILGADTEDSLMRTWLIDTSCYSQKQNKDESFLLLSVLQTTPPQVDQHM